MSCLFGKRILFIDIQVQIRYLCKINRISYLLQYVKRRDFLKSCGLLAVAGSALSLPSANAADPSSAAGAKAKAKTEAEPLIQDLNAKIKAYCDATPGCTYVDYYSAWLNASGTGAKDGLTYDNVHPTPLGFALLEKIILPYLQ